RALMPGLTRPSGGAGLDGHLQLVGLSQCLPLIKAPCGTIRSWPIWGEFCQLEGSWTLAVGPCGRLGAHACIAPRRGAVGLTRGDSGISRTTTEDRRIERAGLYGRSDCDLHGRPS